MNTSHYPAALARKTIVEAALKRAMALLRETDPKDVATARQLFRRWFENRLNQDFRRRQSHSRIKLIEEPYPSNPMEEMAWTADQRLMLTKSESEARFIAELVIERAGEQAGRAHLAKLIEHGLHEMRSRLFPRRDDGDFADEINDRLVKKALKDARLPTAINQTHLRSTIETKAMSLRATDQMSGSFSSSSKTSYLPNYDVNQVVAAVSLLRPCPELVHWTLI